MSLKEIQGVLEAEDIALIEQILARKNEQIHEQMRALRLRHNAVERAIASIDAKAEIDLYVQSTNFMNGTCRYEEHYVYDQFNY